MRRALRQAMPAFSTQFHLKPQDFDDMTFGEIDVYVDALIEVQAEHRKLRDELDQLRKRGRRGR